MNALKKCRQAVWRQNLASLVNAGSPHNAASKTAASKSGVAGTAASPNNVASNNVASGLMEMRILNVYSASGENMRL